MSAGTPSILNADADTRRPGTRSASTSPEKLKFCASQIAVSSKDLMLPPPVLVVGSAHDIDVVGIVGRDFPEHHEAVRIAKGSGSSSRDRTTLKTAVLAPIPRPSVSTATAVNPGRAASIRTA